MEGFFPSSSSLSNQQESAIGTECWQNTQQITQEIFSAIQPTLVSERRRMGVIDYVKSLIRNTYGTEVLPFGSWPLKTYLPDGDIDLTVIGDQINEECMARDIYNILEGEAQRGTRFLVRGVQYIPAQVKIVKCFVDHISVDISFNQMAGRCSLCFLEQVNQLIGRDHLFKRSILLIKAWCYYESRTLGAHHGLISTYGLDIMILSIINMFHSSLEGPLAVLYKFLDYYSTFKWERYCITIYGRVAIPSFPNIVVKEESSGCDLLLTKEFLNSCVQYFSIPTMATENREQFPVKFMNIMDPLKSSNNLGRSVNRANFYRIKSALNLGTSTLKQILMGPSESMDAELRKFFGCTLERNLGRGRPDEQFNFPVFGDIGRRAISSLGRNYGNIHGPYFGQDNRHHSLPVPPQPRPHISHPFAQNLTPCMRYRWTELSHTTINGFIPREIGHRNASQLLSSPFGIQERETLTRGPPPSRWNAMARASGTYVPNMGARSWNSRGPCTFIPTVREQWVPRATGTPLNLEGTSNYSTHMGARERLKCQGTSTSLFETGMEGTANWQGPGTSITDMSYIDVDSWDYKKKRVVEWVEVDLKEARNEEFENCFDLSKEEFSVLSSSNRALASMSGPPGADDEGCSHSVQPIAETEAPESEPSVTVPPKVRQSAQPLAVESEDRAGSSGSFFKLSLEEFPVLPSQKKAVAQQTREPVWTATTAQPSEVAQRSSCCHLGAFRHSPPPSSPALESSDHNEVVEAEGYQLEDEKDFPPLGL